MNSMLTAERLGRWENLWASVMWFSTFFKWVVSSGASVGPAWHTVSSRAMETHAGSMPFSAILLLCGEHTGLGSQRGSAGTSPQPQPVFPSPAGSGPRCPLRPAGDSTHICLEGWTRPGTPSLHRGAQSEDFVQLHRQ